MTTLTHRTCASHTSTSLPIVRMITRAYGLWSTRRALAQLDPAQLKDVGITSEQARREANRAVWDVPANWRD